MSEAKDKPSSATSAAPRASLEPGFASESIGSYLAAQRRLRGISIEELSQQTRIPLRSLERLESGSFDADVDGFVRGFVRTVAEALGLDPDETLNRTLPEPGSAGRERGPHLSIARVVVAGVVLALLVGVGFAVQQIAASLSQENSAGSGSPIVMRRDPVRALAEAQGIAALSPRPAMALASQAVALPDTVREQATQGETAQDSETSPSVPPGQPLSDPAPSAPELPDPRPALPIQPPGPAQGSGLSSATPSAVPPAAAAPTVP